MVGLPGGAKPSSSGSNARTASASVARADGSRCTKHTGKASSSASSNRLLAPAAAGGVTAMTACLRTSDVPAEPSWRSPRPQRRSRVLDEWGLGGRAIPEIVPSGTGLPRSRTAGAMKRRGYGPSGLAESGEQDVAAVPALRGTGSIGHRGGIQPAQDGVPFLGYASRLPGAGGNLQSDLRTAAQPLRETEVLGRDNKRAQRLVVTQHPVAERG